MLALSMRGNWLCVPSPDRSCYLSRLSTVKNFKVKVQLLVVNAQGGVGLAHWAVLLAGALTCSLQHSFCWWITASEVPRPVRCHRIPKHEQRAETTDQVLCKATHERWSLFLSAQFSLELECICWWQPWCEAMNNACLYELGRKMCYILFSK